MTTTDSRPKTEAFGSSSPNSRKPRGWRGPAVIGATIAAAVAGGTAYTLLPGEKMPPTSSGDNPFVGNHPDRITSETNLCSLDTLRGLAAAVLPGIDPNSCTQQSGSVNAIRFTDSQGRMVTASVLPNGARESRFAHEDNPLAYDTILRSPSDPTVEIWCHAVNGSRPPVTATGISTISIIRKDGPSATIGAIVNPGEADPLGCDRGADGQAELTRPAQALANYLEASTAA